ncbi:protein kinase domain-containing protein [Micromonospora sp. CPCC 206061]|uniref:protein kinase domain-containing protein n=1 Tax=Micromonospora sp. CPCC 206061 TaxID=3122410 RepID=UPI002FF1904E
MTTDAQSLRAIAAGYRVLGRLRRGPDSAVYRAVRDEDETEVALKVLLSEAYPIDEEAANLRRLPRHPNLVRILGTGRTVHGFPFFAMEYHPEGSYADLLARSGPVPVEEAIRVGRAVAEALDAVHGVGLLHRDVTPANILRGADGPLLTDFGIAALPEELSGTVALDRLTPHHAAPEALLRQAQDARSDVYGLASTVWTLLTGHPPFAAPDQSSPDPFEYRENALHRPLPPVPREDVPPWLQEVLRLAMAKAPADRYPDAAAFAAALRDRRAPDEAPSTSESAPVIQVPAPGSAPTGHTMPAPPAPVEVSGRGSAAVRETSPIAARPSTAGSAATSAVSGAAVAVPDPVSGAGSAAPVARAAGPAAREGDPATGAGRAKTGAAAGSAADAAARAGGPETGGGGGKAGSAAGTAPGRAGRAAGTAGSERVRDGDSPAGAGPVRAGGVGAQSARSKTSPASGAGRATSRESAASGRSTADVKSAANDSANGGEAAVASDSTAADAGAAGGSTDRRQEAAPRGSASAEASARSGAAGAAGGRAGSALSMDGPRGGAASGGYVAPERRPEAARAPAEESSALAADRPAVVDEPTALEEDLPALALDPPPAVASPSPADRTDFVPVPGASAGPAWQRAEAHPQASGSSVDAMPHGEPTAAVRTATAAPGYAGHQAEAEALPAYQIAGYAAEDAAPGYAASDVGGLIFHADEPELDDAPPPDRRRGVSKVAIGVAAVVIGLSAALVGTLAYRSLFEKGPEQARIVPGAPENVQLADERFAVTLSWRDVSEGSAIVYVVGGPRGKTPSTMASAARGATSVRVVGVNPEVDYCFRLVAAFSVDEVATSDESCTARFGATPGPS